MPSVAGTGRTPRRWRKAICWVYVAGSLTRIARAGHARRRVLPTIEDHQRAVQRLWEAKGVNFGIRIVLLLPLLREQRQVAPLLRNIARLQFPPGEVLVVPITTERETREAGERTVIARALADDLVAGNGSLQLMWKYSRCFSTRQLRAWLTLPAADAAASISQVVSQPSTQHAVDRFLSEQPFPFPVRHIHYPKWTGNKASQMNYAIDVLRRDGLVAPSTRTYIGVYDADSSPHPLTLVSLAVLAANDPAPAFQQYPIYLAGASAPPSLMGNEAWLQTARSVAVEYPRQMRVNRHLAAGRRAGATFTYCIGHGEFLRADWLLRAGFPDEPPIDDLPTGIMLSLARLRIVPLPFFDVCGVPDGVFGLFRQTQVWFTTQLGFRGPRDRASRYFGKQPVTRMVRGAAEQALANAIWLAWGPLGPLLLITSALKRESFWTAGLLSLMWLDARATWSLVDNLLDRQADTRGLVRLPFNQRALLRPVLNAVGPWLALATAMTRSQPAGFKTER